MEWKPWECPDCKKYKENPDKCPTCGISIYDCLDCRNTRHYFTCSPIGLSATDYLFLAVQQDCIPTQANALADFGFNNCSSEQEISYLLSLYVGLIKYHECPRKEVEEFCKKGKNAELIDKYYLQVPAKFTLSDYYHWFAKNKHIVDNQYNKKNNTTNNNNGSDNDGGSGGGSGSSKTTQKDQPKKANSTPVKEPIQPLPNARYSFTEGPLEVRYGSDENLNGYFFSVEDSRLAWQSGASEEVNKVIEGVDPSREGIIVDLNTYKGIGVSIATIAVFMRRYGVPSSHVKKVREGKPFKQVDGYTINYVIL